MKKIMLVAGLLFCSQTIFAQLEKGMIAVGLTSAFSANKTENEYISSNSLSNSNYTSKTTSYNLAPTVSYFITNRFAIGLSVGYAGYKTTTDALSEELASNSSILNYSKTTSNGTTISPYVKYYFPLSDNFSFLIKGSVNTGFLTGKTSGYTETTIYDASGNITSVTKSDEYGPNKTSTVDMGFGLSPGVLFMPSKKIGLEFSLGNVIAYNSRVAKTTYNSSSATSKSTTSGLEFFNFNTVSIGTGVYFFF